jgi:hypothetical protein
VFKDFQREMERFHQTGLIMKNGWQNLIGIIFIFPVYFLDIFLRTGNCFIRICGKEKLIGLSIIKS